MYHISLYEEGRFCTHIGGSILTLGEALAQLKKTGSGLKGQEVQGIVGIRFDREGATCALVITDEWGSPIKDTE